MDQALYLLIVRWRNGRRTVFNFATQVTLFSWFAHGTGIYRFESCPDYKTLHNRFLFLPCEYEHTAGFLNKDVYEQKKICIFKIKNKMMELIFSSFWTFIGTIILISTCANAVAVIIKHLRKWDNTHLEKLQLKI